MENFFIRSIRHTPIDGHFLWSSGYILRNRSIYKEGEVLHTLAFDPLYFQALEYDFVLLDGKKLIALGRNGEEELIIELEHQPVSISFDSKDFFFIILLNNRCLLFNEYYQLLNTYDFKESLRKGLVNYVEWNTEAKVIYISTGDSILMFNYKLELIRELLPYSGSMALRNPNILAVYSDDQIQFYERNGLRFDTPLTLSLNKEPSEDGVGSKEVSSVVEWIKFMDEDTMLVVSRRGLCQNLLLYFCKNHKWYRKIIQEVSGRYLGVLHNEIYFQSSGLMII